MCYYLKYRSERFVRRASPNRTSYSPIHAPGIKKFCVETFRRAEWFIRQPVLRFFPGRCTADDESG
jgi:hypothetical protein